MSIEKLRPSFTFDSDRLCEIAAVVPEAFADGKINWDTLREALGEHLEDESQEHFGLFWPGKREARRLASLPSKGTLVLQPGLGVDEETTHNLFIEGENLEVLKLLQKSYAGCVKMIYIDPPYNTGNDFIYSDDFVEPLETYLRRSGLLDETSGQALTTNTRTGGRYHSNWLNMMYPRLLLARQLLKQEGIIFISIDDHEVQNLRIIMDEVFGEENFVAQIIWQKVYAPKSSAKYFSADHDYIVAYAKSLQEWAPELLPRTEAQDKIYKNPDKDPRGLWRPNNLAARNYYSKGLYSINCPGGRIIEGPPKGSYWRISEEKFRELDKDGRIWWGEDGNNVPAPKIFMSEVKQGRVPQTLWFYQDVGHTQEAKKQLLEYVTFENTDNVLDTVKPYRLIQRMLQIATSSDTEDIILDFFSGSASTAHGILEQNFADDGNRRFIMVQFPEQLPSPEKKLKTIADIGRERIRQVIKRKLSKQQKELSLNAYIFDLGFKSYILTHSNYKEWQAYIGNDASQLELRFDQSESPLVEGWKPESLLVEILLLQGFPLDSHIRPLPEFKINTVQEVSSDFCKHRLYVCLDPKVQPETVSTLRLRPEDILVCLDSALSDEAKIQLSDQCNLKVI